MPELPEVETMVRGIRNNCTGRLITSIEFVQIERRPIAVSPSREEILERLRGQRIRAVSRLAKRILLEMDSDETFVIEPRMTGLLVISDPPTREHRRVVWHLQPEPGLTDRLEFWDRRGLGTLSLFNVEQMAALRTRVGPDALEISCDEWQSRLSKTGREIKVALLDQQLVAGIGNLYASEILHRARISPFQSAASLTSHQVSRLSESTQHILLEAIHCEGSTLGDGTYRNALNKDGSYQNHHLVYQRADEICKSCLKAKIQKMVQAQRVTFFCPKCQK